MTGGSHALPVPHEGPTRVLIADDHDLIRGGLAALIRAAPGLDVVGEAVNGLDAVAQAARAEPDVVLMDMRMPELDGVAACTRILSAAPEGARPRVLALTSFDIDEYVYAALRAGASGFLLKDTAPERLLRALHLVAAGDCLFAPSVTRRLVETYTRASVPGDEPLTDLDQLTPRELEILRLVATGACNEDIAALLTVSEATVKSHLSRAMTKLGLCSRAQAVVMAYESGLVVPRRCRAEH
ncbi:response regulator transcription factor [Streptomyces sp. NPDC023998]|uniref:response regulator transcription factor n=1 Tax=Streptomyces sp. NPDC023998 TaxID=3154597 RepID=UPI003408818E